MCSISINIVCLCHGALTLQRKHHFIAWHLFHITSAQNETERLESTQLISCRVYRTHTHRDTATPRKSRRVQLASSEDFHIIIN